MKKLLLILFLFLGIFCFVQNANAETYDINMQVQSALPQQTSDTNTPIFIFIGIFVLFLLYDFFCKKRLKFLLKPSNEVSLFQLENTRKLLLLDFIFAPLLIFLFIVDSICVTTASLTNLFYIIGVIVIVVTPYFVSERMKTFEAVVKKTVLPNFLQSIAQNNDFIEWTSLHNDYERINEKNIDFWDRSLDMDVSYTEFISDDVFGGVYKNIKFSISDGEYVIGSGKSRSTFKGIIITIKSSKKFDNFAIKHKWSLFGKHLIASDKRLKKVDISTMPILKNYKVQSSSTESISNVLVPDFIAFLANLRKRYSFFFKENNIYIFVPRYKDSFKLGSIFKNVNDNKQFYIFSNEFMQMLNIVEAIGSIKEFNCN